MTTLRRKLIYHLTSLLLSLVFVGAAALWGINAMRSDFSAALEGNTRLRVLYDVRSHLYVASALLNIRQPAPARIELGNARDIFYRGFPAGADTALSDPEQTVRDALDAAVRSAARPGQLDAPALAPIFNAIDNNLIPYNGDRIRTAQERADRRWRALMYAMSALLASVAIGATVISIAQYRSVIWPLVRMKLAVERIASGRFNGRVHTEGPAEFAELAANFNRMAARLEDLYHNLQQNVDAKSRELLRNERLASVGLLAAGVAHEINNPLSIMTAHAELSLEAIERGDASAPEESARSLAVICEEAFRCKRIVEKLLTLGRGPQQPPTIFSLGDLVRDVVAGVAAMPNYHNRRLLIQDDQNSQDYISGRSDEIKQVILNLLFNGLEATPAGGEVRVTIAADPHAVQLSVTDTGRGMPQAVLDQIFEPFFTDIRGKTPAAADARRGTGLGLSIAHAIVLRHGGEISAHSDGPGLGSRFTVTFPAPALDPEQELHA